MSLAQEQDRRAPNWPKIASFVAAAGMIMCCAAVFIQFLAWIYSALDTRGMLLACLLVVGESYFSFWLATRLPTAQRQMVYYRVTEMIVLLVALKFFTELRGGLTQFWSNFILWPVAFPLNIINLNYVLTILPILAAWWAGNVFAADLSLLGLEDPSIIDERFRNKSLRSVILQRFLTLGMLVVILASIPPQTLFQTSLPPVSSRAPSVVAYFAFGIILVSLTRYVTLETNWLQAKLRIPAQIPRRWFAYSALILGALIFLISWLPTNYDLGLLGTIQAILFLIYQFIMVVYGLILVLFSFLVSLFMKKNTGTQEPAAPQATPTPLQFPQETGGNSNWELVRSIILWGGLIVLAIIALRQYLAYNRDLAQDLRRFRPLKWLGGAWKRLIASLRKANRSVGIFIENGLKRLRSLRQEPDTPGEWRFINPRRLSPREKVIFFYLALVRRAKEAGLPRQEDQTPYEYARSLTSSLKEEADNVDAMTEAFIEARYSRHVIPARSAKETESIWERIRKTLRKVRRAAREKKTLDD